MALIPFSEVRDVPGLSDAEKLRIRDFLQGAVYCWCKNRKGDWFSLRHLMGGDNFYWQGTPLVVLFNKHIAAGSADAEAVEKAGREGGWLLKRVIADDKRAFNTKKEELIRQYLWNEKLSPVDPAEG
jgi:hypothetical protein